MSAQGGLMAAITCALTLQDPSSAPATAVDTSSRLTELLALVG